MNPALAPAAVEPGLFLTFLRLPPSEDPNHGEAMLLMVVRGRHHQMPLGRDAAAISKPSSLERPVHIPVVWLQIRLPTSLEAVPQIGRICTTFASAICQSLQVLQEQAYFLRILEDTLCLFRSISRKAPRNELAQAQWNKFYTSLTDGVPVGTLVCAEDNLRCVSAWNDSQRGT